MKIISSGICGSDLMEWYRVKTAPRVLGHEIAGVIEKLGDDVKGWNKGDRVFVTHHVPCNACHLCLKGHHTACDLLHKTNFDPGGFAEYVRVPAINIDRGMLKLPDSVTFDEGTFIEPLACVIRGFRIADFKPPESVLVLGSGAAGVLCIALAKSLGAGLIAATDSNPYRLKQAQKFGAQYAFDAKENLVEKILPINRNRLMDFVIVATGAPQAFKQALAAAEKGGKILFFAPAQPGATMTLSLFDFWDRGLTLTSSYGAAGRDLTESLELIEYKRIPVQEMITHRLNLDEAQEGFNLVSQAQDSLKVILRPHTK
ncbi:MAG: alcohol dehydrogenase catalytic domain-containing protein [Elusimicrobia bacterium]|nr:alcohol dehydrogenase catalytic domain-containing protein [Elusimicrobiota bacterium]